jgi:hypothetical protein
MTNCYSPQEVTELSSASKSIVVIETNPNDTHSDDIAFPDLFDSGASLVGSLTSGETVARGKDPLGDENSHRTDIDEESKFRDCRDLSLHNLSLEDTEDDGGEVDVEFSATSTGDGLSHGHFITAGVPNRNDKAILKVLSLEFVDQLSDDLVAQVGAKKTRLQLDFMIEPLDKEHVESACVALVVGCVVLAIEDAREVAKVAMWLRESWWVELVLESFDGVWVE